MGSYTAQILVGSRHPHHGGLSPDLTAQTFLSENSRPCWVLKSLGGPAGDGFRPPQIRWIPESVTTILEDGLLFLALHGLRHEDLIAQAPVALTALDTPLVNLGEVNSAELARLRAVCRTYDFGAQTGMALIISVFAGSSILSQLPVVDDYRIDCELLTPLQRRVVT